MARTLHTARLLKEQLSGSGRHIERRIERRLCELDRFDMPRFKQAILEAYGRNMSEHELQDALFSDALLSQTAKLSETSAAFVQEFERAEAAKRRMMTLLDELHFSTASAAPGTCWLLVTHDGLAGHLVRDHYHPKTSLERGRFIALDRDTRTLIGTNDPHLQAK